MKNFTKTNLLLLRKQITDALKSVSIEHELELRLGSCSFSDFAATFKLEAQINNEEAQESKAEEVDMMAKVLGYEGSFYGKPFSSNGKRFKLTGINMNRPKYPVSGEEISTGKQYKFPEEVLKKVAQD